ncbi:MAG TPA: glycosyltransferase family 4 protein [bacterium]|jgi:glycosyltransferase involved in cell wall biosynthesis|nr:glycosyltransferase family 4 protein [bacterium]
MNIILVHNFYGHSAPSGENKAFEAEKRMLREKGHRIMEFTRNSDEVRYCGLWGRLRAGLSTPWNFFMARKIRRMAESFKPDIVHVHNVFPLVSPAVFWALDGLAPRVLTLHNYRLFCPAAIPLRRGKICTECLDKKSALPSLLHGCYQNSRAATLPLAVGVGLHRALGTWKKQVDAFIALTDFQAEQMAAAGLEREKIHVKPNFFPDDVDCLPWPEREDYILFVGRLSEEKGATTLAKAWRDWGPKAPELRVIGEGPQHPEMEGITRGLPVKYLGQLPQEEVLGQLAKAKLLVIPSECFEGFPMVLAEASAFGVPAAVSNIGPLPRIVRHLENGLVFSSGDRVSIRETLGMAWNEPGLLERLGRESRNSYRDKYTKDRNYGALIDIYHRTLKK